MPLCADEVVMNLDIHRKIDSEVPKMEVSVNTDDANKDASNGGNQGRIINLSRAASSLSPTKSWSVQGRDCHHKLEELCCLRNSIMTNYMDEDFQEKGMKMFHLETRLNVVEAGLIGGWSHMGMNGCLTVNFLGNLYWCKAVLCL